MAASEEALRDIAVFTFGVICTFIIVLVAALFFRDAILKKIFGNARASLDEVSQNALNVLSAAVHGQKDEASEHAGALVRSSVSWYSWVGFYRWVIGTCAALLVAFAGFAGTMLLFEQNQKIQRQTDKIAEQTDQIGEQTGQFQKQNEEFGRQNSLIALSITSELRDRLARLDDGSKKKTISDKLPLGHIGCHMQLAERDYKRAANRSSMLAIGKLASGQPISEDVVSALENLMYDRDATVAYSALKILDSMGRVPSNSEVTLKGIYVEAERINSNIKLNLDQSLLTEFDCPNCTVSLDQSVYAPDRLPSFGEVKNSMVIASAVDENDQPPNLRVSEYPFRSLFGSPPGSKITSFDGMSITSHTFSVLDEFELQIFGGGYDTAFDCRSIKQFTDNNPVFAYGDGVHSED